MGDIRNKKPKSECAVLSDDLLLEIFVRVDCKSIFRCMSVSKDWRIMICNPAFVNRYITTNSPSLTYGVFFGEYNKDQKFHEFGPKDISVDIDMDTSLSFLRRNVHVVASHNGFLLCAPIKYGRVDSKLDYEYIVCNPLTKQQVNVTSCGVTHKLDDTTLFCYTRSESDSQVIEFKVICFTTPELRRSLVIIYSSETRQWSRISHHYDTSPTTNKVLYRESIYFCCRDNHILVFDLKRDSVAYMEFPVENMWGCNCLGVSSGALYYAVGDTPTTRINVWVLKDGTVWSLTHSIELIDIEKELPLKYRYDGKYYPRAIHPENPHLVMIEAYRGVVVFFYNMNTRKIEAKTDLHCSLQIPVVPYSLPPWNPLLKMKTRYQ